MQKRLRFYTSIDGNNDEVFEKIIQKAIEIEKQYGNIDRIVFITPSLGTIGWLETYFSPQFRLNVKNAFLKGVVIPKSNTKAYIETIKTYENTGEEIIITLGLSSDIILSLEENANIIAIMSLPPTCDCLDKWARITNAININDEIQAESFPNPECIVSIALDDLSYKLNLNGLPNCYDDQIAKTYLRALQKCDCKLDEDIIESYLLKSLHWTKNHTDKIIKIVKSINSGKSFHGGDKTGLKRYVDRWKAKVKENSK
jgi:hypothetical protein